MSWGSFTRRRKVAGAAMFAIVGAAGAVGFSGTAQAYPPEPPAVTFTFDESATGDTITFTVPCVVPEIVRFEFNGETKDAICEPVLASGFRNGFAQSVQFNGTATAEFAVPAQVGQYTVTAQLLTTGITFTQVVTVTTPGTGSTTGTTIPAAGGGSAAGDLVRSAIGLLLVGGAMSAVAGRRRQLVNSSS